MRVQTRSSVETQQKALTDLRQKLVVARSGLVGMGSANTLSLGNATRKMQSLLGYHSLYTEISACRKQMKC